MEIESAMSARSRVVMRLFGLCFDTSAPPFPLFVDGYIVSQITRNFNHFTEKLVI